MRFLRIALLGSMVRFASAQLNVQPNSITLLQSTGEVLISDVRGAQVKFKYAGVETDFNAPNFIVVVPSSGTTPSFVRIGLNYAVVAQLQPGSHYGLTVKFTTVDQTP